MNTKKPTKSSQKNACSLLSRYSLPPNSLGYCGKGSATEKFKKCIINGECDGIEEELSHFIVLYPYLKTIAKLTGRNIFDYKVAECFWLGNELINEANVADYEILLQNFITQGVPESFVSELRDKQPKHFIPFHLFQVLHVGVGKSSGAVPFNLDSINNCMIRWGEVTKIQGTNLTVNLNSLELKDGKYQIILKPQEIEFDPLILKGLKVGDYISVHWKIANNILTKSEVDSLVYWSNKVLDTLVY